MTAPLYLNACSATAADCDDAALRSLLAQYQTDARRLSRLTKLALAALLPALADNTAAQHLFLAAPSGSPHKLRRALNSLNQDNLPNLLDFNAALPNAALFACSQAAAVSGSSVFCTVSAPTLMQPLWLAANTLWQQGGSAWIGWAYEAPPESGLADGALWWQIGCERGADCRAVLQLQSGSLNQDDDAADFWPHACKILQQTDALLPSDGGNGVHWRLQKA